MICLVAFSRAALHRLQHAIQPVADVVGESAAQRTLGGARSMPGRRQEAQRIESARAMGDNGSGG